MKAYSNYLVSCDHREVVSSVNTLLDLNYVPGHARANRPFFQYIMYICKERPSLWSSGESSWLQIQRSRFDSRLYQIF
jgi:hypothetical protein